MTLAQILARTPVHSIDEVIAVMTGDRRDAAR